MAYELRASTGMNCLRHCRGVYRVIPVRLGDGTLSTRQYSLTTSSGTEQRHDCRAQKIPARLAGDPPGRGSWALRPRVSPPQSFPLHDDERPAVLIVGGSGIPPIKAMAEALRRGTRVRNPLRAKTPGITATSHPAASRLRPALQRLFQQGSGRSPARCRRGDASGRVRCSVLCVWPGRIDRYKPCGVTRIGIEPGRVQ